METPASHGDIFVPGELSDQMSAEKQKVYRSGVGKLLYLSKWSRPDIQNITRELSRYFMTATLAHDKAMRRVMTFCLNTKNRALLIKPKGEWNGKLDENYFFEISGVSDSDYAKDMQTRKSVSGYTTFLNGALVTAKSKMQECVTLLVSEAELVAVTNCIQDMLYIRNVLELMGLKVKVPMKVDLDNKGAKDIINNWSVGGRTRHVGVRFNFLRELKESGVIEIHWISTHDNCSDILTKNLPVNLYNKHSKRFCVDDHDPEITSWEGVESIQKKSGFEVIKNDTG